MEEGRKIVGFVDREGVKHPVKGSGADDDALITGTPNAEGEPGHVRIHGGVAEGQEDTVADGAYAHAEGKGTKATARYAHSEGHNTLAEGWAAHSEGYAEDAEGIQSLSIGTHVEGYAGEGESNIATGYGAHSEGRNTKAYDGGHAEGNGTIAHGYQHVCGQYNVEDTDREYVFIVGNGTAPDGDTPAVRSNAFAIKKNGYVTGDAVDTEPINNSHRLITGGGVYAALAHKIDKVVEGNTDMRFDVDSNNVVSLNSNSSYEPLFKNEVGIFPVKVYIYDVYEDAYFAYVGFCHTSYDGNRNYAAVTIGGIRIELEKVKSTGVVTLEAVYNNLGQLHA